MRKYMFYVAILSLIEISLALKLTFWREAFWTAVSTYNIDAFYTELSLFCIIAFVFCIVSSLASYYLTRSVIEWRKKLNCRALAVGAIACSDCNGSGHDVERADSWQCYKCKGKGKIVQSDIENYAQRVQQDCTDYPDLMLNIGFGFGKALVYIITFSISLVLNFSIWYLTIIALYAIVSTYVAKLIAKPLISLNYRIQVAEATYRSQLTMVNFTHCLALMLGTARKTKHLNYFQTFYNQIAVILPILIVAPAYFSKQITFGALMQANSTMATISENLSYFITNFGQINRLLSCRRRLLEIGVV